MVKSQDVEHTSLLFDDQGSDPATPASGFSRIYTKADGAYHIDDAGTVTGPFAETTGSGGGLVDYDILRYTTGDISLGTGVGDLLSGVTVSVTASAGDVCVVTINGRNNDSDGDSLRMDVATVVSSAAVHFFSSLTATAVTLGVSGWFIRAATNGDTISGSLPYVVQAGDISAGSVLFQMAGWGSGAGKVLAASSTIPLYMTALNMGQP